MYGVPTLSLVVEGAAWRVIAGIVGDETVRIGERADADIGKLHLDCIADGLENSGAGRPALDPRRHADTRTERKLHDDVVMEMVVPAVHVVPEPFHQLCRDSHIPVAQARVVLCHNALLSPDVRPVLRAPCPRRSISVCGAANGGS